MKKSQSPLVGSKRRRYRQHRAGRSSAFRSFRSAFAGSGRSPNAVKNGPYRKDGDSDRKSVRHLSRKAVLALLLVVFCVVAAVPGQQALEQSGIFKLRKITVHGVRATSEEQIVALAGIKLGQSLLGFRTDDAEQIVGSHPWIDRVSIRRSWPSALNIEVEEHRPLAMINLESADLGLYYVDDHGTIFAPVEPSQDVDFPVITGFMPTEGPEDVSLAKDRTAADAVEFLHLVAQGNPILPMQSVSEIHVAGNQGIIVYLAERPFPIYIGYGNIKARYYQLVRLLERLYRKEKIENIREIRMDYQPDRILVARLEP